MRGSSSSSLSLGILPLFLVVIILALTCSVQSYLSDPPLVSAMSSSTWKPRPGTTFTMWRGQQQQRIVLALASSSGGSGGQQTTVRVDPSLSDDKITALFAWVSRAFDGEPEYNNLVLAMAAIFGNLPPESDPVQMVQRALKLCPPEEQPVGDPIPRRDREYNSLGAMGAGQWMGRYRTRPHALLTVSNMTNVQDWIQPLPRGVKRTLKKALQNNFTVTEKPIVGGQPAPHSSLAHFRCVVEHEVRLITAEYENDPSAFLDALAEATSRFIGTTRMVGVIQEYRDEKTNKIIAFAHEVRKGKTIRGQWFYATNEASKNYVWFHSVHELVRRAIQAEGVDVVDLGPSGSDAFSELKQRYGFQSVVDWPAVADYLGPFWYENEKDRKESRDDDQLQSLLRSMGL